jgi:hypothetical protein
MQPLKNILAVLSEYSPSAVINVVTPLTAMRETGLVQVTIRLQNEVTPVEVAAADVLVLCRNCTPVYRPIFELALSLNIPILYDLDDHLLAAPKGSYTDQLFQTSGRKEMLEWLLRQSTLVRVHSPVLQQVIRQYNPNTAFVWSAVNWALVPSELPTLSSNPIHIVYAAQRETGETMYQFIRQDIQAVLEKYGARICVHFLGYNPPELSAHPLVVCHPFESDYSEFFSQFTRFGYSIGLAPMIDDLFHNSKTNIKFRDYAAAGAVGIYADTPLYRGNGVVDGETGLIVSGEAGSWLPALVRLIENPSLIETIRQQARKYVASRYNMNTVSQQWMEQFQSLPPRQTLSASERSMIETIQWSFNRIRRPDSPWVARLRNMLRNTLPVRWRVFYHDTQYALRKRLHR